MSPCAPCAGMREAGWMPALATAAPRKTTRNNASIGLTAAAECQRGRDLKAPTHYGAWDEGPGSPTLMRTRGAEAN
jgi:hypothetical protein